MHRGVWSIICLSLLLISAGCASRATLVSGGQAQATTPTAAAPIDTTELAIQAAYTPTPSAAPSFTPAPSATPQPSATPAPTGTPTLAPTGQPTATLSPEGPWLVFEDGSGKLTIKNADGGGLFPVTVSVFDPNSPPDLLDSDNRALQINGRLYLIRPHARAAVLLWGIGVAADTRNTFTLGPKGGFFSAFTISNAGIPELLVYELPSGKLRERIALAKCPADQPNCLKRLEELTGEWLYRSLLGAAYQTRWAPDGRALAFAALRGGSSTDLYLYDSSDGEVRLLANGPEQISKVSWSPDGKYILFEGDLPPADGRGPAETLNVVSPQGGDARRLYVREAGSGQAGAGQTVMGWLDGQRALVHNGLWAAEDGLSDLRVIDVVRGTTTRLFDGNFRQANLDRSSATLAIYAVDYFGNVAPWPGYQGEGIYLVSVANTDLRWVGDASLLPERFDAQLGLFVTGLSCTQEGGRVRAFDTAGKMQCVNSAPEFSAPTQIE